MHKSIIIEYFKDSGNKVIEKYTKLPINIGSSEFNNLIFSKSDCVSPNHAIINAVSDDILIFNLSAFGTFLNGRSIKKAVLNISDEIQLGFNGPKFGVEILKDTGTEEDNNECLYKRWYDKDTLTSKALELLRISSDDNAIKVTKALINYLNRQDPNLIYVKPDVNIEEEIKKLPSSYRWYDLNKFIQQLIEGLKLSKPEVQENLSLQIIMMLDSLEIEEKLHKDNIEKQSSTTEIKDISMSKICSNCNYANYVNNSFCISCGQSLFDAGVEQAVSECPNCNVLVNVNNKFCFNCSYKLK